MLRFQSPLYPFLAPSRSEHKIKNQSTSFQARHAPTSCHSACMRFGKPLSVDRCQTFCFVFVLDSNTQIEQTNADVATKVTFCDEDSFPVGSVIEIYWPGDKLWYTADVLKTRVKGHREIYCEYRLDGHLCWHSLHNNKIRMAGDMNSIKVAHTRIVLSEFRYGICIMATATPPLA